MSNLTSTLTLQLVDDGLAKKAQADAEALKRLGASGADLKKLAASNPHIAKTVKHLDDLAARGSRLDAFRAGAKNLGELGRQMRLSRSEVAATAAAYAKAEGKGTKTAERAHKAALRRSEAISDAWRTQAQAHRELRKSLLAEGVALGARGPGGGRGLAIGAAMKAVTADTEAANSALRRQVRLIAEAGQATQAAVARAGAAQRRAGPSMLGGMGAAGRAQLGDIEARRRVAEGMSRPARARAAADADAAAEAAANREARAREGREARKTIAGGALLVAGHKAAEMKKEVLEVYKEVDDLSRYQAAVADLTPEERKSRMKQAMHVGASSRFNDIQVLHAQLDLAQRGVKKQFIEPFIGELVNYGQAMNSDLGAAAKTLEGIIFSTGQNVESPETALKVMRRQVDLAVKMSKIGGLDNDDVAQAFKFGGASGSGAGLSNETMATVFALLRRAGYNGSEAGVTQRALASKLVSPTQKGLGALDAMGVRWEDYTTLKRGASPDLADNAMQRGFGKKLTAQQKQRFAEVFADEDLFGDAGKFASAAIDIVGSSFGKTKKGKLKAQDSAKIAKVFGQLRQNLIESVDAEGLLAAIINANPTLAQANAWATDKHGGKVQALAKKAQEFKEYQEALRHTPEGFAKTIGDKRNEGFAGASTELAGAWKNLHSAVGQGLDGGGEGTGGLLTNITRAQAYAVRSLSELPGPLLAIGAAAGYAAGKVATIAGGALVTGAAVGLATGNGALVGAAAGAAATAAVPAVTAIGGLAASKVAVDAVKNEEFAAPYLDGGMLGADPAGYGLGAAIVHADKLPGAYKEPRNPTLAIPSMLGGGAARGAMPGIGSAGAGFGLGGAQAGSSGGTPATPLFDTAKVDGFTEKLGEAEAKARALAATQATPQVNTGPVDSLISKLMQAIGLVNELKGGVAGANAGIASVNAGALKARSFSDGATPGYGTE